ncbi:hypothetical protein [Amycolatopsis sp. NBC_01286]|nr:hypothetical protein OG570_48170 [Amycolatopsis sp. NBC_01286]
MSKNSDNPALTRPGGMHDAVTTQEARIAEQRRAGTQPTTATTSTNGGSR